MAMDVNKEDYRGLLKTTAFSINSSSYWGEKKHHWAMLFNPQKEGHHWGGRSVTKALVAGGINGCNIHFDNGKCKNPVHQAL